MKKVFLILAFASLALAATMNANADEGYQHGWRVYERPQPGYTYGGTEANPYGPGGSRSYGPGGGRSYGPGGGRSYGPGGGKDLLNPWAVVE
jgi:hypothetical protein